MLDAIKQQLEELKADFPDLVVNRSQFEFGNIIGKGGFGEVTRAFDKNSRKQCAVKQIFSERLEGNKMRRYIAEIRTMAMCDNMFLVPLIGFTSQPPYCIVTELMPNSSLDRYIRKRDEIFQCPLSGTQRTIIAIGIAHGMRSLHKEGIIHRDLKAANILLDDKYYPRICDFGIARFQDIGAGKGMTQKIGTPNYMAPELIVSNDYDNKVDVYSFAMILFEMNECVRAFKGLKLNDIFTKVINDQLRPEFTDITPEPMQKLIRKCWAHNPADRPTFDEIFDEFADGTVEFEDCDRDEITAFLKIIEEDEERRDPMRAEMRKRHEERGDLSEEEEEEEPNEEDYPEEENMSEYESEEESTTEESQPMRGEHGHVSNSSRFESFEFLNDQPAKDLKFELADVCQSIEVEQIPELLEVLSNYFGGESLVDEQNLILRILSKMMERGTPLAKAVAGDNFMSLLPVSEDLVVDACVEIYKPIFSRCPEELDDRHIPNVKALIDQRPTKMFCLFSSLVRIVAKRENSWSMVDLLYHVHKSVMNTSSGKLLLSLFYYLLTASKQYAKSTRGAQVRPIFAEYLKSSDPGTVACAYDGLVNLNMVNEQPVDMSIVLSHLHNGILWKPALNFLACLTNFSNPTSELVRCLIARGYDSPVAVLILIKVARSPRGPDVLVKNTNWMYLAQDHPLDVFRILLILFADRRRQKTLSSLEMFPFVLRAALETENTNVISAISVVLKASTPTVRFVNSLSSTGFLREYVSEVEDKDDDRLWQQFFEVSSHLANVSYVEDWLLYVSAILKVVSRPELINGALEVLLVFSAHSYCRTYFRKFGFVSYLQELVNHPAYLDIADEILTRMDE